jgi:hypothetical protein
MYKLTYEKSGCVPEDEKLFKINANMRVSIVMDVTGGDILKNEQVCRELAENIGAEISLKGAYFEERELVIHFDVSNWFDSHVVYQQIHFRWNIVNEACIKMFEDIPFICWRISFSIDANHSLENQFSIDDLDDPFEWDSISSAWN